MMRNYMIPQMSILIFDDTEEIVTISVATTNSERQLNHYMFEEKSTKSTISIKLENINLK